MLLQLSGLAAGYGAKTVISDVSFALEPGQILAFLGHNGAGKTTTLKTVMGLLPPRAGEVAFDGQRIDRLGVSQRVALGLRLLPEGRGIFPDLSVAENIDVVAARNATAKRDVRHPRRVPAFPCAGGTPHRRAPAASVAGSSKCWRWRLAILGIAALPAAGRTLDRPGAQSGRAAVPAGPRRVQIARDDRGPGGTERCRGDEDRRSGDHHEQRTDRLRRSAAAKPASQTSGTTSSAGSARPG